MPRTELLQRFSIDILMEYTNMMSQELVDIT